MPRTLRSALRWLPYSTARFVGVLLGVTSSHPVHAQSEKLFAAPGLDAAPPSTVGSMTQITWSLALVLLAVFVVAYLLRRLRKVSGALGTQDIEVVAQTALGAKERAVLLKIASTHVLVGVTPNTVNCLHVFDTDALPPSATPVASADLSSQNLPTFKSLLKKSLGMG